MHIVKGCEREVAEASNGDSEERKSESIMRLSWALVHSRQSEDVQRGIAMLESNITLQNKLSTLHFFHNLDIHYNVAFYRVNIYGAINWPWRKILALFC